MSPIGELNFSIATRTGRKFGKMTCFRPLSGSYISQCKRKTKGENHEQFPSPIGELHFSIVKEENAQKYANSFRPLSGSYISQYEHGNIKDYMCACFRPLSGSYISQSFFEWAANEGYMFPSPIGELHFSIMNTDRKV